MLVIIQKLKELGYTTVDEDYYQKVYEWRSWYRGDVEKFHHYKIRSGHNVVRCKRYSLGMAKKVCEDWANLLMNEKVAITLEGSKEQEFIDGIFGANNFEVKANEMQEMAFALGTVAFVPRVVGATSEGGAGQIKIDYVTIENIWPLEWENGEIIECAFSSERVVNGEKYVYLQIHRRGADGLYVIENRLYHKVSESLTEIPLSSINRFANLPAAIATGSEKRLFVIDRPNIANNYDYTLPLGVSVYANAVDVLRGVDIAYDSYVNEFVLGKKRIMVKPSVLEYLDGEPVFDADDLVFYSLPEDTSDGSVITPIDMSLRTAEHNVGIQDQLNILSSKCGFGEKHYSFNSGSVATATQVISENSTLFRTIKKHEIVLGSVLKELCRILLWYGNNALSAGLDEDVEMSIDFDDSIIEDKQTDFARDMQMLNAGILNDWEFRMTWMNEDEGTAKKMLPKMEDLTTEPAGEDE